MIEPTKIIKKIVKSKRPDSIYSKSLKPLFYENSSDCKDGQHYCNDEFTCCTNKLNGEFGCCPLKNGVSIFLYS